MTMKRNDFNKVRVMVLVHDGFEETEMITPVDMLRRAGAEVTVVSMTGSRLMKGSHGIDIMSDVLWEDFAGAEKADCLFLPGGGQNSASLRNDIRVTDTVKRMYEAGKIVTAICAAPTVLERAGILAGKKVTSYPGCLGGSEYEYLTDAVVEDGNIITGRGAGCAMEFGLALVGKLFGNDEKVKLAGTVIYPHTVG